MQYQRTSNATAVPSAVPVRRATVTRLPVKRSKSKTKTRAAAKVDIKVVAIVGMIVFFIGAWSFNLVTRASIADTKAQITECDERIETLDSYQVSLQMQLEKLYSFEYLEEKAKAFGMVKGTDTQIKYIDTRSEDKAEITNDDN